MLNRIDKKNRFAMNEKQYIRSFLKNLAEDNYVEARQNLRACLVEKMRGRISEYEKRVREEHNGNVCWVGKSI